jgi:TolB-like protein/DNA-binding SARP family transcriptional activator
MGALELTLLGGCEGASGPDRPLRLSNKKAWALLAYLALQPGRAFDREHLANLLWGDRFDEQARKSLRQTLYEIRTALGDAAGEHLDTTRDTVCVNGEDLAVDALRFEALTAGDDEGALADADTLYRGPLLQGLDTGQETFEEWLAAERARLHVRACGMLERLAALRLERGDAEAAIETARRLIRLDPLNEEAHRLLIRALAAAGRRSEALTHFTELKALLEKELQAAPEPETHTLVDAIRAGTLARGAARQAVAARAPQPGGAPWRWATVAAALVVVGFGAFAGWLHWTKPDFEPAAVATMAYPLPDKPSIAVLPFATYSGEQRDDFIAKGLTEDLITALSRVPQLFVISRTSSFAFKDTTATATEIAKELGIRYIVEGSIQRSSDTLRINAQLVDAVKGHHLWADNFDGEAKDLFALQDEIVRRILVELQVKLTGGDHARVASRGTRNLDAWLLRMQGMAELYKFTRESTVRTRELMQRAHEADPQWNRPVGGLAWSYWWEARMGWTDDREAWIRKGIELAERAIEMDPNDTLGYMQLGNLYQLKGDHDRAITLREKAVEIAPNDYQANWGLGTVLYRAGQTDRAVEVLKHAERLSPRHPASLSWALAEAQLLAGHYEDAIETARRASARVSNRAVPHVQLTAAYTALGRMEEARGEVAEVLRVDPKFTVSAWKGQNADYKDRAAVDKLASLLLKAGLPE